MVALVTPLDPEHLHPTPEIDVVPGDVPLWVQHDSGVPSLPPEYTRDPVDPVLAGGGPVDQTPRDHEQGPGPGHGLTEAESSVLRRTWGERDLGGVAKRSWSPRTVDDGVLLVDEIDENVPDGASPRTIRLQSSGITEPENDPYARRAHRVRRWHDREFDLHRWIPERRALTTQRAYLAQAQPPVPEGDQTVSPWSTSSTATRFRVTPDTDVVKASRRVPERRLADVPGADVATGEAMTSWGL
jgi:hypothetical protein